MELMTLLLVRPRYRYLFLSFSTMVFMVMAQEWFFWQCKIQGVFIYPIHGFKNSLLDNNVIIGNDHSMYAQYFQTQVDKIAV